MSEARFDEPDFEEPTQPEPAAAEPTAQAEPASAPQAEAEPAKAEDEVKPVPTVPLSALNEERHRIRELRAQIAERDQRLAAADALKQQLEEMRRQQQAAQQKDGFQKDPLGSIVQEIQSVKQAQEAALNETRMREQQQAQIQQFTQAVQTQVQQFKQTTADYDAALMHLVEARKVELRTMGVPESVLDQAIENESVQLAQTALQNGRNPGELVYELAKARGYTGKPAPKGPSIDVIEKGQRAAATLSEGGGDSTVKLPSLAEVAKMSDEDFSDWEKNSPDSPWYQAPKKRR